MLDYKHLEALAVVVREGGFEKAARVMHRTQSAISQRIKLLEDHVGQALLIRSTPVHPTAAGQELLKHYRQVVLLEESMEQALRPNRVQEYVTLRVGLNADSLALWFMDVMHAFLTENKILLDLEVDDQDQTHALLEKGEVMGCISTKSQPTQGCKCLYLGRMNYIALASKDFAARWFPRGMTPEHAAKAPAVIFNHKDDTHWSFFASVFPDHSLKPPAHYVPSVEKFVEFILAGHAYGLTPKMQAQPHMNEAINLAPGYEIPVDLYWHHWNLHTPLLENFTKVLKQGAERLLKH